MIINAEGDEIVYRCAYASEQQAYIWRGKNRSVDLGSQWTATQIKEHNAIKYNRVFGEDYDLESYKIIETETEVYIRLENMLAEVFDLQLPDKLKKHKITDMNLWLSPSDYSNFRYSLVDLSGPNGFGYKAGRKEKPVHLSYIRDLMINVYSAKEIKGFEADDALGIMQTDNTIACHIDKDINMIPGHHYDWVNQEYYYIEPGLNNLKMNDKKKLKGDGLIFFYAQLLMGDRTDNIPGIKGIGDVGAYKALVDCKRETQAFDIVCTKYQNQYKDGWMLALREIADLIWICQHEDETGSQYLQNRGLISW